MIQLISSQKLLVDHKKLMCLESQWFRLILAAVIFNLLCLKGFCEERKVNSASVVEVWSGMEARVVVAEIQFERITLPLRSGLMISDIEDAIEGLEGEEEAKGVFEYFMSRLSSMDKQQIEESCREDSNQGVFWLNGPIVAQRDNLVRQVFSESVHIRHNLQQSQIDIYPSDNPHVPVPNLRDFMFVPKHLARDLVQVAEDSCYFEYKPEPIPQAILDAVGGTQRTPGSGWTYEVDPTTLMVSRFCDRHADGAVRYFLWQSRFLEFEDTVFLPSIRLEGQFSVGGSLEACVLTQVTSASVNSEIPDLKNFRVPVAVGEVVVDRRHGQPISFKAAETVEDVMLSQPATPQKDMEMFGSVAAVEGYRYSTLILTVTIVFFVLAFFWSAWRRRVARDSSN